MTYRNGFGMRTARKRGQLRQILFWLILFWLIFGGEFFFDPLRAVDAGLGDGATVDDDVGDAFGFECGELEIAADGVETGEGFGGHSELEGAEKHLLDDLHEGDMDGVGVLDDGQDGRVIGGIVAEHAGVTGAHAGVEEAVAFAFECGRAALDSVDFDVLAAWDVHH